MTEAVPITPRPVAVHSVLTTARQNQHALTATQHAILLGFIRGETSTEISARFGIHPSYLSILMVKARRVTEYRTLYQLIALETINLMENQDMPLIESVEVKINAAVAGR